MPTKDEENKLKPKDPKHYIIIAASLIGLFYMGFSTGVVSTTHIYQSKYEKQANIIEEVDALVDKKMEDQNTKLTAGISEIFADALASVSESAINIEKTEKDIVQSKKAVSLPDEDESDLDVVSVTDEEYELILKCVQCEAGYWAADWSKYSKEDYKKSQKAITNCILNLADYKNLSITETIQNTGRFAVWPSAISKCGKIDAGVKEAVDEVLAGDRDYKVTCFRTKHYHGTGWSTPMYYVAGSYFSYINDYVNNMEEK